MKIGIIPVSNLLISFLPVLIVIFIFFKWGLNWKGLIYAAVRMLSQLLLIGYFLSYIFEVDNAYWTILIIFTMFLISGWISLHSVKNLRKQLLKDVLLSLLGGAIPVLFLVTAVIIPAPKWYAPSFLIPLAGMVLANAMNTIGLAAERFESEKSNKTLNEAQRIALSACLIPQINSFLAVGLVSLPGMMTGQILSGVSPLIAVRYQVVVMTMVLGAGGLSAALYLLQQRKN